MKRILFTGGYSNGVFQEVIIQRRNQDPLLSRTTQLGIALLTRGTCLDSSHPTSRHQRKLVRFIYCFSWMAHEIYFPRGNLCIWALYGSRC
jgi:hypothetical protein